MKHLKNVSLLLTIIFKGDNMFNVAVDLLFVKNSRHNVKFMIIYKSRLFEWILEN
jgi:hypothetical protein